MPTGRHKTGLRVRRRTSEPIEEVTCSVLTSTGHNIENEINSCTGPTLYSIAVHLYRAILRTCADYSFPVLLCASQSTYELNRTLLTEHYG